MLRANCKPSSFAGNADARSAFFKNCALACDISRRFCNYLLSYRLSKLLKLTTGILLALALQACHSNNNDNNDSSTINAGIYITGFVGKTTNIMEDGDAMLWKGDEEIRLNQVETGGATGKSVFVSDNDVYVAGASHGGFYSGIPLPYSSATLWKNGEEISLAEHQHSSAESVFILGDDTYVAGWIFRGPFTKPVAVLWKNGERIYLTDPDAPTQSQAHSVFVQGRDVYVSGYTGMDEQYGDFPYFVTVWKNGEPTYLNNSPDGSGGWPTCLFVSGNDVYVGGREDAIDDKGERRTFTII